MIIRGILPIIEDDESIITMDKEVGSMVIKSETGRRRSTSDVLVESNVLIERLKRLRALNSGPDKIGLTQYTWRSFSINRMKRE